MKDLTMDVVLDTAKKLIAKNDVTTTLEIKDELRTQDYFATQDQISTIMRIYAPVGLEFIQAGNHREYFESNPPLPEPDEEMQDAIRLCEANGLVYSSSSRQIKNKTLYFTDPQNNEAYSITKTGYARRHRKGDMYQLNKKIACNRKGAWSQVERVLLPGQYFELAQMVIRIALKHRN